MLTFSSIPAALEDLKTGEMLIVVDSSDRENQADVIFPAETATVEKVNFLIKECRGMVCVPLTQERAKQLHLPLMVDPKDNTEKLKCSFTVTVDAKTVTSFGISASDRCLTIQTIAKPDAKSSDLTRPGYVFPIVAAHGGPLERQGHTEATVELSKLAGFSPVGVLCEVLRDDGEVSRNKDLAKFAKKFDLKIISLDDLITHVKYSR